MKKQLALISFICVLILIVPSFSAFDQKLDDSNSLGDDEYVDAVIQIAEGKLVQLQKTKYQISSISQPYGSPIDPLFYVCLLEPTGFLVISVDESLPPVLAYSFENDFGSLKISENMALELLIYDMSSRRDFVDLLPASVCLGYSEEQEALREQSLHYEKSDERWPPEGSTPTEGWIVTQWDQYDPYNSLCPLDGEQRSLAGCPSITMAQILNYYETTMGVRFNDSDDYYHNYGRHFYIDDDFEDHGFPSFPQLNDLLLQAEINYATGDVTDDDLAALIFACGVACTQVYSAGGSGTWGVSQAFDAYHRFGFDDVVLWEEATQQMYEAITNDIKAARPVHLAVVTPAWDAGHNLNIDGYHSDGLYHLNFGWGGSADGWYQVPEDLTVYGYDFTVVEGVITNIVVPISGDADLECSGDLLWSDISPGEVVDSSFVVENVGENGSLLNWEVISIPDWGEWEISPEQGTELSPEDGPVEVHVRVTVPSRRNREFDGGIVVSNVDSPGDTSVVQVVLTTAIDDQAPSMLARIQILLERIVEMFPWILKIL